MNPMNEQEEKEYMEMTVVFIGHLKKAFEDGKAKGWTDQQIKEANPTLFEAVNEIDRISKCPVEELLPVGICVYCNEPVFKTESFVNETVLLHTDCEKDVWAEIQDQKQGY